MGEGVVAGSRGSDVGAGVRGGWGTESTGSESGTAAVGWWLGRVRGRLREERRSTGRGEGIWPVTVAMASECGVSGSWTTTFGDDGAGVCA